MELVSQSINVSRNVEGRKEGRKERRPITTLLASSGAWKNTRV